MRPPFAQRVSAAMASRGYTLRSFCRAVELDPSFFSKVLAGKRSPPSEEAVLRRIAGHLGLDAAELIVAAGRIPAEWSGLWTDPALFEQVHGLAGGVPSTASRSGGATTSGPRFVAADRSSSPEKPAKRNKASGVNFFDKRPLADELL